MARWVVGFSAYATERLTGFDGAPRPMAAQVERTMFPDYYADMGLPVARLQFPACNGPITWRGPEHIQRDIALFKASLAGVSPTEAFMPLLGA